MSDGYEVFDQLGAELRRVECDAVAQRIQVLLHETAWTTSSELLGALGQTVLGIPTETVRTHEKIWELRERCLALVRQAWPAFGRL